MRHIRPLALVFFLATATCSSATSQEIDSTCTLTDGIKHIHETRGSTQRKSFRYIPQLCYVRARVDLGKLQWSILEKKPDLMGLPVIVDVAVDEFLQVQETRPADLAIDFDQTKNQVIAKRGTLGRRSFVVEDLYLVIGGEAKPYTQFDGLDLQMLENIVRTSTPKTPLLLPVRAFWKARAARDVPESSSAISKSSR